MGGLLQPDSPQILSLEESLASGLIDGSTYQSLLEIETSLHYVQQSQFAVNHLIPVAVAMEEGHIKEQVGIRILELQLSTGGFRNALNKLLSLENAKEEGLLSDAVYNKLHSCLNRRDLIDPNTAEKLSLAEFHQRCVLIQETGLRLLPVNQQSRATVCLRSGRKVGIFRAVQEGLIDQQVTIRLLEAQLFAGGITDPRSGHRLTVDEALRHGLLDEDLACALLTHQLQAGGIIDPVSGERLDLNEAVQRDLLSSRTALRVLESLWTFMGMLWPESGELLSISDALQQGVISGELAQKVLSKRHSVGAIYCSESAQVIPLAGAEKMLGLEAVKILEETKIPDILPAMIQTGCLNVSRWGSSSLPTPSSPLRLHYDTLQGGGPEEQVKHQLLSYLMTHSYINARSGARLLLLDSDLWEIVDASQRTKDQRRPELQLRESSDRDSEKLFSEKEQRSVENLSEQHKTESCVCETEKVKYAPEAVVALEQRNDTDRIIGGHSETGLAKTVPETQTQPSFQKPVSIVLAGSMSPEVEGINNEEKFLGLAEPESHLTIEMHQSDQFTLVDEKVETVPSKEKQLIRTDFRTESTIAVVSFEGTAEESQDGQAEVKAKLDQTNILSIAREGVLVTKHGVSDRIKHIPCQMDTNSHTKTNDSSKMTKTISVPQSDDDAELERMANELLEGGLLTDGAQKLPLDEAVSQGLLPGHSAVKVMSKAGLFGGFLDVSTCESLSIDDVMQEGIIDEDLLTSVLQSEKTLSGVVDVEHGQICSLKDASQRGLLDPETVARLLEAQVVSGGIVDLCRGKKVSVTLAANLGLIEEKHKEDLLALEKSCRGKRSEPKVSHKKLTLQLQMDGVIDPKTKKPVSVPQALQQGIIDHEEAQEILLQQVAEGGIVHHGSGIRLSVSNAVQQGLIDQSSVPNLEEFEKSCQRQDQYSSDTNTHTLQANAGFIYDDASKSRLTLTEAVSYSVIDEDTANKAMASSSVRSGILDPHSACVVPYSAIINQGKIDIETGQRFLEVRPFRGIRHKQDGNMMTMPEAVKTGQVDPVPALRVLQSQADSGGIINISNGKRLSIPEAVGKGLVEKDIAKVIVTTQMEKGGLINPVNGQRVSDLKEACQEGLISEEMAAGFRDDFGFVAEPNYKEELGSLTNTAHHAVMSKPGSNLGSPTNSYHEGRQVRTPHLSDSENTQNQFATNFEGIPEVDQSEKLLSLQHCALSEGEEQICSDTPSKDMETDTDVSLDVLTHFMLKAEKRLQEAIVDLSPKEPQKELQHQPNQVKVSQVSQTEFEDGKKHATTFIPGHTPEPDNQMDQAEDGSTPTKMYMELKNYEENDYIFATCKLHDGQTLPSEETNRHFASAAESLSHAKAFSESQENVGNGKETSLFTLQEGQNTSEEKTVNGKNTKQERLGPEVDKRLVLPQDLNVESHSEDTEMKNEEDFLHIDEGFSKTHVKVENVLKRDAVQKSSVVMSTEDPEILKVPAEGTVLETVKDVEERKVDIHFDALTFQDVKSPENKTGKVVAVQNTVEGNVKLIIEIKEDLEVHSDLSIECTESNSGKEAVGFDQKSEEYMKLEGEDKQHLDVLQTPDMCVISPEVSTDCTIGKKVVIDQKPENVIIERENKEYLEVLQCRDLSVISLIECTEGESEKGAVGIDQKSEGYVMLEGEDKLHLDVSQRLQTPDVHVVSPVESTKKCLTRSVVTDQKPEDLKVEREMNKHLEALQGPDVGVTSPIECTESKSGKETVGIDQRPEELEEEDKIRMEALQTPHLNVVSLVESTENKMREKVVIDQKSEDDKVQRENKEDLEVLQCPYESVTSASEGAENKSGKEAVDIDQRPEEFEGEDKLHLEVLQTPFPVGSTENKIREIDKKPENVKVQREVKVVFEHLQPSDLCVTSYLECTENKPGKEAASTDEETVDLKLERDGKLDLGVLQVPKMSIVSPVEGADKTGQKIVNDEKSVDDMNVKRETEVPLESRWAPDKAFPVVGLVYETGKDNEAIEQKSTEKDVKIEKEVEAGAPKTSACNVAVHEVLHQRDVVEEVDVMLQRQPTENGNTNLAAEMPKDVLPNLLDDYSNTRHELQGHMQQQIINQSNMECSKELDVAEVCVSEQSDRKKKKKKKNKKAKQTLQSVANAEEEAEEYRNVASPQTKTLDVLEKEEMEQPQKQNQTQLEKEALLMKAKESILRKVFERGVTEKQAAEKLEALRQGSGKERHAAAWEKPTVEQQSSTVPTKEKTKRKHQTPQVDKNEKLVAEEYVPDTGSSQIHFSQTVPETSAATVTPTVSFFGKKQDLSSYETTCVARDTSKQRPKPINELDGERTRDCKQEPLSRKNEKLGTKPSEVNERHEDSKSDFNKSVPPVRLAKDPSEVPKTAFTENKAEKLRTTSEVSEQLSATLTLRSEDMPMDVSPQSQDHIPTTKTETISKELLQDVVKEYSHFDTEARNDTSLQESTESGLSQPEEISGSDTTQCWENDEEYEGGLGEKQTDEPMKKQRTASKISKVSDQECINVSLCCSYSSFFVSY